MSKKGFVCLLICAFATPLFGAAPLHRVPGAVAGRYIVQLDEEHPSSDHAEAVARLAGVPVVHTYSLGFNGFSMRATEQKAQALTKVAGVAAVWEVPAVHLTTVVATSAKGLDRIDQRTDNLDGYYTYFTYTTPRTLYIVDSGMDPRPSELGTRVAYNVNFYTTSSGVRNPNDYTDHGLPLDDVWHGTATAVVAAGANFGVARSTSLKIANVRVTAPAGFRSSWDDVQAGIQWVTAQRNARPTEKHIANLSLGSKYDVNFDGYTPVKLALQASLNAGVAWIFAAGNDKVDGCRFFPAWMASQYSGAISVGASFPETDVVLDESNQGPCVEIYAPSEVEWGDERYGTVAGGTSAAAPHVAGVFAERWGNAPTSSAGEIEGLIKGIATPGVLTGLWPTSNNLLLYSLLPKRRPS